MSFKEVTSLFVQIEQFLNQDCRLENNKPKQPQFVEQVKEEIWQTCTKISFYKNSEPDQYPENSNKFKFLGSHDMSKFQSNEFDRKATIF